MDFIEESDLYRSSEILKKFWGALADKIGVKIVVSTTTKSMEIVYDSSYYISYSIDKCQKFKVMKVY